MRAVPVGWMVVAAVALAGPYIVAAYAESIPATAIADGADSFAAPSGAHTIAIHDIADRTYALVASNHRMQITDITRLTDPVPVSSISRGADSAWEGSLQDVAVYDISGRTFALLGGTIGTGIVDITRPDNPVRVAGITYDTYGHAELPGGSGIVVHDISGRTYAVVANDRSVHVVDVTRPADPRHEAIIFESRHSHSSWTRDIAVHEISGRTYVVAASLSHTRCLTPPCGYFGYVDIIDITRPDSPQHVATAPHNIWSAWRAGPQVLAVHDISNSSYAVVASDAGLRHGMHILDITLPDNPLPVSAVTDDMDGFTELGGAADLAIHDISNRTYAVVASRDDSGVQIVDITLPDSPVPVAAITDDAGGFGQLNGASGIAIRDAPSGTYALVASRIDSAVQIVDITNPADVSAAQVPAAVNVPKASTVASLHHGGLSGVTGVAVYDVSNGTYAVTASGWVRISDVTNPAEPRYVMDIHSDGHGLPARFRASDIAIRDISNGTYALASSRSDSAVQIIDITQPGNPVTVAVVTDDAGGFTALGGVEDIAIHDISNRTYAVVASSRDDGVQIIDITQPGSPFPVAALTDGVGGFAELDGAHGIAVHDISNRTYAVVASSGDDGVQIIDITSPDEPLSVAAVTDDAGGFAELDGAKGVAVREISNRTYAFVASSHDSGVQVIDITRPDEPLPVAAVTDDAGGFAGLNWAHDITIRDISNRTYAFVAGAMDYSVQVIDITRPDNPLPAGQLVGKLAVDIHDISGRTYVFAGHDGIVAITDVTDLVSAILPP